MSGIESYAERSQSRGFYISRMTEHDLLEVVEIEESSGLSRWGWDAYHAELLKGNGALMLVAREVEGETPGHTRKRVLGFIAARLAAGELHVNNVAVRHEFRRAGIGKALLGTVLAEGKRAGALAAFLEVRASNRAAQALYARCGFAVTGRRRNYYSDPAEDALVMSLTTGSSA